MKRLLFFLLVAAVLPAMGSDLRLATFRADITPPVGAPLCAGGVKPVESVTDPLYALGLVILGPEKPIVLCAVDWCEIRAADHEHWRGQIARAAGTTPERVAVQSLHQHNAPIADSIASKLCAPLPLFDIEAGERALASVSKAVAESISHAQPLTHLAYGEAKVSEVASNRRVMGNDGRVAFVRYSATKEANVRAAPEGLIDPMLKTLSFWNGETKLAVLHWYATHPMSYYGDGKVTSDFVGLAREQRTHEDGGVPHIYFTGCAGNITAGKYNDGSPETRAVLTSRIHEAMVNSEAKAERVTVDKATWQAVPVKLAVNPLLKEDELLQLLQNDKTPKGLRISTALKLSYLRHSAEAPIQFTSLDFGHHIRLLHLPGEAFVQYQLFAQQQDPGGFIATASYGDGGPGYIPMRESFAEGGYEPTQAFAAPESEQVMKDAITALVK